MAPPNQSLTEQPTSARRLGFGHADNSRHTLFEQTTHPQFVSTIPSEAEQHVNALLRYPIDQVLHWLEVAHSSQPSTSGHHQRLSLAQSEAEQPSTIEDEAEPSCEDSSSSNAYWCTYCDKSFSRKGSWKRHEENFHEPQRQWKCPSNGCKRTFSAQNKFVSHHRNDHGCRNCWCGGFAKVEVLPRKCAWGCGFCSCLLRTWNTRSDHIASHFEGALGSPRMTKRNWDHTKVIRGLLSQPEIDKAWRSLLQKVDGASEDMRREFVWNPKLTSELLQRLEYQENHHDLLNTVQLAYVLGSASQDFSLDPSSMLTSRDSSGFITPACRTIVNEGALDSSYCCSTLPSSSTTYFDILERKSIDGNSNTVPGNRQEERPANVSSQAAVETPVIHNFLQQLTDDQDDPNLYPGYGQYGPWASSDDRTLYAHWDTSLEEEI